MTWAPTCTTDSQITGLTLPGMMLEPGWMAGSVISPSPQRGPLFMSRTSLAIFIRLAATLLSAPLAQHAPSCAPCASKWFGASAKCVPVSAVSSAAIRRPNSGCVFRPVPTAVPPIASSRKSGSTAFTRAMPCWTCAAYPENSWPRRMGVASIRCVRPVLSTSWNSCAFASSTFQSCASAGSRSRSISSTAETCSAVGITSLLLWPKLTWSLGCTLRPRISLARCATTSLAFMLDDVPLPVWNTSIGNSASHWPPATSIAAVSIAPAISRSTVPSPALTRAAAALISPSV